MSLKDLEPGEYSAILVNATMILNQNLQTPEVVITFEMDIPPFGKERIDFKGLYLTKSGDLNKKVQRTLKTIELMGSDEDLGTDAASYNKDKVYSLTIAKNEKGFTTVEWVNDPQAKPAAAEPNHDDVKAFFAKRKAAQPTPLDKNEPVPF